MSIVVPFTGIVTRIGEVAITLADPPRVALPAVEPRVLRTRVARYAGRRLLAAQVAVSQDLVSPARATVRWVEINPTSALPGVTDVLEVAPLPFGIEPALRRLRGLPTFYLSPFDAALADDDVVGLGAVLASMPGTATVAAMFPDGLELAPSEWMQFLGDGLLAVPGAAAEGWRNARTVLYPAVRCRVIDHAGRPLADDSHPEVKKTFTVTRRRLSDGTEVAPARTVTLGADSDLEAALAAGPGSVTTLAASPGEFVDVLWAGAPPSGDVAIPMCAIYGSRVAAAPEQPLRIPDGATAAGPLTLQVLDLARWFASVAPELAIARYRTDSRVEPLIDGIATFQLLAADLRVANAPGMGAHLAAWTLNRFPLDAEDSDADLVDLLHAIVSAQGVVRVLPTKFINLRDPNVPRARRAALLLMLLLSEAALLFAAIDNLGTDLDTDGRAMMAFLVVPVLATLLAGLLDPVAVPEWLLEKLGESARDTVDDINALAPGAPLAVYSQNRMRLADNPLADVFAEPLWGFEADVDQFNVWHNKAQLVRRPASATDNGWIAYLGGIDINKNRVDSPGHGIAGAYHDVHARITGPAAHDVFQSFQERWEHERARAAERGDDPMPPADLLPLPPIDASVPGTVQRSRHVVRCGRTYHGPVGPVTPPLSYAPNGDAGIYRTLRAAIRAARDHIYIEEQYFTPDDAFVQELLEARLKCNRLLILLPGETDQPFGDNRRRLLLDRLRGTTTGNGWGDRMLVGFPQRRPLLQPPGRVAARGRCWLARACGELDDAVIVAPPARALATPCWLWIDGELMLGHAATNTAEGGQPATRIEVLRGSDPGQPRWGASRRGHIASAAVTMASMRGIYVHAKTMMVDDTFVSIGSANLNRRGFFSDGEINVFAIPEQLRAAPDNPARALRTRLWAEHLGLPLAMGPVLLEDSVAGFELFRRSHALGNRFTPLAASDVKSQLTIADETILPFDVLRLIGTLLGNAPFAANLIYERLWNLVIDGTSRTDLTATPGPV